MKFGTCSEPLNIIMQIPKERCQFLMLRIVQYNIQIIGWVRRMLVDANWVDTVVSIKYIDGVPDECFGSRCTRSDDTFKGNRVPVKVKWFSIVCTSMIWFPYTNKLVVNSGLSTMAFPWSSTGGLMSYTARRQDAVKYNELSLKCLPGQILRRFSVRFIVFML